MVKYDIYDKKKKVSAIHRYFSIKKVLLGPKNGVNFTIFRCPL